MSTYSGGSIADMIGRQIDIVLDGMDEETEMEMIEAEGW